jgi:hypothetical protein
MTHPIPPQEGNVLAPQPDRHQMHGDQSSAAVGIAKNLLVRARDMAGAVAGRVS